MRRFLAFLCAAALLAAACSTAKPSGKSPAPPPPAPVPTLHPPGTVTATVATLPQGASEITAAAFVDAGHGWIAQGGSLLVTADGGRTWRRESGPGGRAVHLDFISASAGWAVLEDGTLMATRNGGVAWFKVSADAALNRADFVDEQVGFGGTRAGDLLATRNGGLTWQKIESPCPPDAARPFSFISAERGWILCGSVAGAGQQPKRLLQTIDGGAHWRLLATTEAESGAPGRLGISGYVSDLHFRDENRGWYTAARAGLFATDDGGRTWRPLQVMRGPDLTPVLPRFVSARDGFVVSSRGAALLKTTDGGSAWQQIYPAPWPTELARAEMVDARTWFAWGTALDPTAILRTTDGGRTWRQIGSLSGESVVALSFPDATHGWAIAEYHEGAEAVRALYRTTDGGVTWTPLRKAPKDPKEQFFYLTFVDDKTGYLGTGWGHLQVTRDGGESFAPVETVDSKSRDQQFVTPDEGWKVNDFALMATGDGGRSWREIKLEYRVWQFQLLREDTARAVAAEFVGGEWRPLLIATGDGGRSWTRYELPGIRPAAVRFATPEVGLLVDETGEVFTTGDSGASWTQIR